MMVGGIAYLYPLNIKEKQKKLVEWTGITLIFGSYFFIAKDTPWPGYLAIFPVIGSFFVMQAQRNNSFITSNIVFQKIGAWSYSIYLWHWPFVVVIYYFSLDENFIYLGLFLSVAFGYLSKKYIENIHFKNNFNSLIGYLSSKPIHLFLIVGVFGGIIYFSNGLFKLSPTNYQDLITLAKPSPYRESCHLDQYSPPKDSCEYFGSNISWASFGDSHSTEIAYALAIKLKSEDIGLKHFSFSGCKPSYNEAESFSLCSKWYNESVNYILNDKVINNVVINHRFTAMLFNGSANNYPAQDKMEITNEIIRVTKHIDELILRIASEKDNVYIYYPIPELSKNIDKLIGFALNNNESLINIADTNLKWYNERNKYIINHFNTTKYPKNVHLLNPVDVFCDEKTCYAVKDEIPLYFDDNHPSIYGAAKLVELIESI